MCSSAAMKIWLRRALGPAYPLAIRLRTSPLVYGAAALAGRGAFLNYRRSYPAELGVDIAQRMGMGAILTAALRFYAYAEDAGMRARIICTSPLYAEAGQDMFDTYFERAEENGIPLLGAAAFRWAFRRELPVRLALDRAEALFARHFRPNARLRAAIEAAGGTEPFALSIHVRGTDKFLESGQLELDRVIAEIERHMPPGNPRVFLATDEAAIAALLRERFPHARFTSFDLGEVTPGLPRHFSALGPEDKALEALVNMFLLARAPVCVRTSSYLSALSRIANPFLRTVTVNRSSGAETLFPEREILDFETDA